MASFLGQQRIVRPRLLNRRRCFSRLFLLTSLAGSLASLFHRRLSNFLCLPTFFLFFDRHYRLPPGRRGLTKTAWESSIGKLSGLRWPHHSDPTPANDKTVRAAYDMVKNCLRQVNREKSFLKEHSGVLRRSEPEMMIWRERHLQRTRRELHAEDRSRVGTSSALREAKASKEIEDRGRRKCRGRDFNRHMGFFRHVTESSKYV